MVEYLIKRVDGEWFDLHVRDFKKAFRPNSDAFEQIGGEGEWRIRTQGVDVAFYYEDPGIQICIEGELSQGLIDDLVDEFRQNIELTTGQKGQIFSI